MVTAITKDENMKNIAKDISSLKQNIVLLFAFNGIGKTRLSVEYKNFTKKENGGNHAGVYYNAYSEDLFAWDNDTDNNGYPIKLNIIPSSLNKFHSFLSEDAIWEKLENFSPKFNFTFNSFKNSEKGIESISFFTKDDKTQHIKISRGEQSIFIFCFFLALFDVEGWADKQNSHFFIDDPISSLDDNNIFVTASTILELIENNYENRKIIITTHHAFFYSLLSNWLSKGEKAGKFKNKNIQRILKNDNGVLKMALFERDVFLYHLELLQTLQKALNDEQLYNYHFALLRQIIENIASFLGTGQVSYVLDQIGFQDKDYIMQIINALSHDKIFRFQASPMVPNNKSMFTEIFNKIINKYNFIIHTEAK